MHSLVFAGIGEVLFDIFDDGTETLGGAPLNCAVHAHQLATQAGIGYGTIVSRVGSDRRGERLLKCLQRLRMSSGFVGIDSGHPTGVVSVFMQDDEPGYQIETETAWDYIVENPGLKELAGRCSAVCFGSLAQRSAVSRATIRGFLKNAPQAVRLFDVNLRQNTLTGEAGFSPEIVEYGCRTATHIKANQSELFAIFDLLGIRSPDGQTLEGIRCRMGALLARFPVRAIIVSRGADGTLALTRNGEYVSSPSFKAEAGPHPVGAGDACAAGILFGTALGWDIRATMELANRMGADVVCHPSATPPLSASTLHFMRSQLSAQRKA